MGNGKWEMVIYIRLDEKREGNITNNKYKRQIQRQRQGP